MYLISQSKHKIPTVQPFLFRARGAGFGGRGMLNSNADVLFSDQRTAKKAHQMLENKNIKI
jgi:hypothetical protein